jgi:signal transduction histidine kinase
MQKILVIEDVTPLRNDMVEMLRLEGYDVRGAENGVIGLAVAQDFQPDLVICDIMMPELDGYGVLHALRADMRTRTLPFIFLTAKSERAEVRKGMGLGADDYLTKPFENEELIQAVRTRLGQRDTLNEDAEAKLARLRESITTALPHELRTPLNTVIGFSDMLMVEANIVRPEDIQEWAGHIHSAAQRLNRLVENYLTYVRIQSLSRDAIRLAKIRTHTTHNPRALAEHQAIFSAQKHNRAADLVLEYGDQATVAIGENDLTKIVDEILDNAFKFSQPGMTVKLITSAVPTNKGLMYEIQVIDYGRGMKPEQIKEVGAYMQFDRLIQEQQGAGMGLAVAKGLAEMYLGSVRLESEMGSHTAVTVTLPTTFT